MIGPISGINSRFAMSNAFSSICRNNDAMYSSVSAGSSFDKVSFTSNLQDCDNLQNSVKYQLANANKDSYDAYKSDKIKRNTIHLIA